MKKFLFSISLLTSVLMFSQITYTEGFETDNGNFSNNGFFRSKFAVVCAGDYALIRNLYDNATTGNTIFSSLSSSGAALDISFKYRTFFYALQGGKVSGDMVVEYSADGGSNYHQIGKLDLTTDITTCTTFSYSIPENAVPKDANFKLRVTGNQKSGGDFYLILDDFKFSQTALGTTDLSKSKLKIYPNPVKDLLYIGDNNTVEQVIISDASGRQIKSIKVSGNSINLKDLKSGNYILSILDKEGKQQSSKIIKQ